MGVRVNTIVSGTIDTPIFGHDDRADAMKQGLIDAALLPRQMGLPEELAYAIVNCITNPCMTAETIRIAIATTANRGLRETHQDWLDYESHTLLNSCLHHEKQLR